MKKILFILVLMPLLVMGQTTTENYTKVTTYKGEGGTKPSTQVAYYDGLGRPTQSISVNGSVPRVSNNIIAWQNTWTAGNGPVSNYHLHGTAASNENRRMNGLNPFGENALLWECGTDGGSNADGGWNTYPITVDKNVGYRYSVWVKRTGSQSGNTYHGTQNVNNLDGTFNSNPYFWFGNSLQLDKWYLMVGVIHPVSYIGTDTGIAGLYDMDGNKVIDGAEFKWASTTVDTNFRSFLYYSTDLNAKQYLYNPIVQKMDGTEVPFSNLTSNLDAPDIVVPVTYDNFGRQTKEYLPYASAQSQSGKIYPNAIADVNAFYNTSKYENTLNPYSEKLLEASPMNRILEQGAPGDSWKVIANSDTDHTIKFDYQSNTDADKVKLFKANIAAANTISLQDAGYYAKNQLYKTITKDENWKPTQTNLSDNTTVEFKNKSGQVILKRTQNNGKWHDTYYVYDAYGNLTYVLPPMVNTYAMDQQLWINQYINFENINSFYTAPYSGSNEGYMSMEDNQLHVGFTNFENGPNAPLNTTTPVLKLNAASPLPNMVLGPVTIKLANGSTSAAHYTARIENGDVYLSGNGTPAYGVAMEFTIDMATVTNATVPITNVVLEELAYQYKYDDRNRLIEKKLPGKAWEYIVYDKLDRPILTQDANLRLANQWLFTKYDAFNRVAYTGIWTVQVSRQTHQDVQNSVNNQLNPVWSEASQPLAINIGLPATTAAVNYSNSAFPNSSAALEVLTMNYYDTYSFNGVLSPDAGVNPTTATKSMATGSKVKVLGTNDWITTVMYYDAKGRVIHTLSQNGHLGTTDKVTMTLDFIGKVLATQSVHVKGSTTVSVKDLFDYDHADRLLTHKQQINNLLEQLIAKNTYDALGQLITKNVGGKTAFLGERGLQKVDFNYNIRGWMKDINNLSRMGTDLFAFHLNYQDPNAIYNNGPGQQPLYNGNISGTSWKTDNVSSSLKSYGYQYDNLNRLTHSVYAENEIINNVFNEDIQGYDRNGNISILSRNARDMSYSLPNSKPVDLLIYNYNGNKLLSVIDNFMNAEGFTDGSATGDVDYSYDGNGNMVTDKNKKITQITYNHLNLPTKIVFNNADVTATVPQVIEYTYAANGTKLKKTVKQPNASSQNTTTETQYAGSYIYEKASAAATPTLQFFSHPEGYVAHNAGVYSYVFQYTDHLGNVRLSYKDTDGDGIITGASTEVFNDGFESGNDWSSQGFSSGTAITSYDTAKKHSGNLSGKLEKPTAGKKSVHNNSWIAISNAQPTEYLFSGWIYSDGPAAELYLFKSNAGETGYPVNFDYISTSQTNRWVYVEKKVTIAASYTKLNLRVDNNGGGNVWFDDLSIRKLNPSNKIEIVEENNYYPFGLKHKGYNDAISNNGNYVADKYKFQSQERQDELGLNWDSFKWRNYDYAIGRFMSIDPLSEEYAYQSTYAFAENKVISHRELEGLEGVWFGALLGTTEAPPLTGTMINTAKATIEVGAKSSESGFSESTLGNFSRGRATEVEQLAKNGLEKNTESFTRTDPKTGRDGTTIPDSFKKDGGTVEIKDVGKQSLTKQLRLQKEISNERGVKPELIINEGAKLSEPLKKAGFDIKTYRSGTPTQAIDNTAVRKPDLPRRVESSPKPKREVDSSMML